MASEESSKPSGLSPPSASGTSFGAGRVHVDAGNFPDSTATDQTPTLEDNDLLEAGVFHDSDVDIATMVTTTPMGSVSQLTIGNPAKFTVAPSDALTRQPISNNDNEISDVDAPWSLWDPSVEFVHPSDDTAQDLMDQRDEATYGSDTIDMEVQQPSEASPTQYNASTPETDESDILENPPGSDYQPSDEDETLLPSRTTGKAKTNAENNDSNTPIENLQPSSEASPARFEASTDESHREDVWNREEEEKPVELLRALRSERVHKIGLSLKYLPNLELFEEVSEQLKERGITRSALACEEWWNHNRWYSKYRDLLEPSQPTSTTTTGHITDVSRLDEADAAAQQALDDENDSPRSPAGNKRSQPELESDQEPQSPAKVPKRTQTGTVDKALATQPHNSLPQDTSPDQAARQEDEAGTQQEAVLKKMKKSERGPRQVTGFQSQSQGSELLVAKEALEAKRE